jgi:hypothetical protein
MNSKRINDHPWGGPLPDCSTKNESENGET